MIDVSKIEKNSEIFVDTEGYTYRLIVQDPQHSIVEIETGDPRVQPAFPEPGQVGIRGQLLNMIAPGQPMQFKFRNCVIASAAVLGAEVSGKGWHYEVF